MIGQQHIMSTRFPEFPTMRQPKARPEPSPDEMLVQHTFLPHNIAWVNDSSMIPSQDSTHRQGFMYPLNAYGSLHVPLSSHVLEKTWTRSHGPLGTSYFVPDSNQGSMGVHVFDDTAAFQAFMRTPQGQRLYASAYGPHHRVFPDPTQIPVHTFE